MAIGVQSEKLMSALASLTTTTTATTASSKVGSSGPNGAKVVGRAVDTVEKTWPRFRSAILSRFFRTAIKNGPGRENVGGIELSGDVADIAESGSDHMDNEDVGGESETEWLVEVRI